MCISNGGTIGLPGMDRTLSEKRGKEVKRGKGVKDLVSTVDGQSMGGTTEERGVLTPERPSSFVGTKRKRLTSLKMSQPKTPVHRRPTGQPTKFYSSTLHGCTSSSKDRSTPSFSSPSHLRSEPH